MRKTTVMLSIFVAVLMVSGCSGEFDEAYGNAEVKIRGFEFDVKVPLEADGYYKGLMFVKRLDDREGMLFLYSDSAVRSFWMKNTEVPLDIVFIDENKAIRAIRHAVPCKADPCLSYGSEVPVRYVLEIRGNLTRELGIREGDFVEISFK